MLTYRYLCHVRKLQKLGEHCHLSSSKELGLITSIILF